MDKGCFVLVAILGFGLVFYLMSGGCVGWLIILSIAPWYYITHKTGWLYKKKR